MPKPNSSYYRNITNSRIHNAMRYLTCLILATVTSAVFAAEVAENTPPTFADTFNQWLQDHTQTPPEPAKPTTEAATTTPVIQSPAVEAPVVEAPVVEAPVAEPDVFSSPAAPANAIASAHPLATQAGFEILNMGGNAFDAAIAVSAALAVVEPSGSGLGGGGFYLLHQASNNQQIMLDAREKAPLAARRNMYLDGKGDVIPGLSLDGPLAAGIPGIPAALAHLAERYGRLSLSDCLQPALRLAEQGFVIDARMRKHLKFRQRAILKSPAAAKVLLKNGKVPPPDHRILQPDLAKTLRAIAESGAAGFYSGPVADKLIVGVRDGGGIWTLEDLAAYQVIERSPVSFYYGDYRIVSAPLPSSGGIVMAITLQILDGYSLDSLDDAQQVHYLVEAMRRAYHDRAQYLGDADFTTLPIERLLSAEYATQWRNTIKADKATPSSSLTPIAAAQGVGEDTTHFSILDQLGNRVAATLSLNLPFGAAFIPPGTGVLLNDQMDDFSKKPGEPNAYGLIQSEANAIEPGKRMLSSMSPTFIESDRGIAILGTPGGSRIISMVMLAALDYMRGKTAQQIVAAPRFHHQYLPDIILYEPRGLSANRVRRLAQLGHGMTPSPRQYGNLQIITWDYDSDTLNAAADPRGVGLARIE